MASDIIDFQLERGRHEELIGREDVMAELEALLLGGPSRGWVLVKGGPGRGKSALLAEWLKRREGAGLPVPPHHFLRRGVEDWDRPEVIKRNLAAQVERLYPELVDSNARPESRLRELLQRVSDKELKPRNARLVLVVDGLDEVEGEPGDSNPLPRFLPHELPPGVKGHRPWRRRFRYVRAAGTAFPGGRAPLGPQHPSPHHLRREGHSFRQGAARRDGLFH